MKLKSISRSGKFLLINITAIWLLLTGSINVFAQSGISPPQMTQTEINALSNPAQGMVIFNTNTGCLNVRNGNLWTVMDALHLVTPAAAGSDQIICGNSVQLTGNTPVFGCGEWSVVSGSGGTFTGSVNNASVTFSGNMGTTYTLKWKITTCTCPLDFSSSSDNVSITFTANPVILTVTQGSHCGPGTVTLGATASEGTINWYNTSTGGAILGSGTSFTTPYLNYSATFYAQAVNFGCTSPRVPVTASIITTVTANAGTDQTNVTTVTFNAGEMFGQTLMEANNPACGTGLWTIVNGAGGSFANASQFNTALTGKLGITYTLRWTITTAYGSTQDDVLVHFNACGNLLSITYQNDQFPGVYGTGAVYPVKEVTGHPGIGDYSEISRCWMTKNLDIGARINENINQINNSPANIVEKYCYGNVPANCNKWGGMYQWNEAMGYNTAEGSQGICSNGWHIPTASEGYALTKAGYPLFNTELHHTKSASYYDWIIPGDNANGFNAIGSGEVWGAETWQRSHYWLKEIFVLHLSTINSTNGKPWLFLIDQHWGNSAMTTDGNNGDFTSGFSVRCVRNQ